MKLAVSDIVSATKGAYVGDESALRRVVSGLTWDSRCVVADNVFLAMPGARVDGNDFAKGAIQRGAGAVVCTRQPDQNTLAVAGEFACPIVIVEDGVEALERLAGFWRDRLRAIVIGVTGSSGKTTTKELLRSVFSQRFKTFATEGNHNNEIGVPATVLSADEDVEVLIVEMGMRGLHQIEHLCEYVKPNIGVITNIGMSHMELLGSQENIARAKAELLRGLSDTGMAILNADDDFCEFLAKEGRLAERGISPVTYGLAQDALVRGENVELDSNARARFDVVVKDQAPVSVSLGIPGPHNVSNALAAYAAAQSLGVEPDDIARGLSEARNAEQRCEIVNAKMGACVLNDAYNASPDSMRASITTLMSLECPGRRIAVLGDMGELGADEYQLHVDVGAFAAQAGLDMLVCVGTLGVGIKAGALAANMDPASVKSFTGIEEAQQFLDKYVQAGDLVLVKASRFMELERIVKGLVS